MEKYLLFGAAGHLGNALIEEMSAAGDAIIAFVLPHDKDEPILKKCRAVFLGDITVKDDIEAFFQKYADQETIVVNSSGIVSIASKFNPNVYNVNVNGVKNIVDACSAHKVKKLVHVSSVHAIEEKENAETITETKEFHPDKVEGLYAKTKAEATAYVFAAAEKGLDASVVFPSGIIGPYDKGRNHLVKLLIDFYNRRLTSIVKGGYDICDVRDVARGIVQCAKIGKKGEGYILSGAYTSVQNLIRTAHEVTGKKMIKSVLPLWFAKLSAPLAEAYYKMLKQPPLYTKYSLYALESNSNFSNEKAQKELNYKARSLKETVRDTFDWLKKHQVIKA